MSYETYKEKYLTPNAVYQTFITQNGKQNQNSHTMEVSHIATVDT